MGDVRADVFAQSLKEGAVVVAGYAQVELHHQAVYLGAEAGLVEEGVGLELLGLLGVDGALQGQGKEPFGLAVR